MLYSIMKLEANCEKSDDFILITWYEHPKVVDRPVYADIHEIVISKKDDVIVYSITGPNGAIKKRIVGDKVEYL